MEGLLNRELSFDLSPQARHRPASSQTEQKARAGSASSGRPRESQRLSAGTMRFFCLPVIAVGVATAFIPSATLRSSMRVSSSSQQGNPSRCRPLRSANAAAVDGEAKEASAAAVGGGSEHGAGTVGVIVCDHGSRRENANTMLFEVAERYRSFSGFDIVEAAHMEIAEPSIEHAFDRCVAAGAQKVVLHPFFLSPGRHVTADIPKLMNAAAKRYPEVAWMVSQPLGLQELMPRVMHAAVSESVAGDAWSYGGGGADGGNG